MCVVLRNLTVHSICLHSALNVPTLATPYSGHLEALSYLSTLFITTVRFISSHAPHNCHYRSSWVRSTDQGGHSFKQLLSLHYPGKWMLATQMGWNRWLCISVTLISWQYSTRLELARLQDNTVVVFWYVIKCSFGCLLLPSAGKAGGLLQNVGSQNPVPKKASSPRRRTTFTDTGTRRSRN